MHGGIRRFSPGFLPLAALAFSLFPSAVRARSFLSRCTRLLRLYINIYIDICIGRIGCFVRAIRTARLHRVERDSGISERETGRWYKKNDPGCCCSLAASWTSTVSSWNRFNENKARTCVRFVCLPVFFPSFHFVLTAVEFERNALSGRKKSGCALFSFNFWIR